MGAFLLCRETPAGAWRRRYLTRSADRVLVCRIPGGLTEKAVSPEALIFLECFDERGILGPYFPSIPDRRYDPPLPTDQPRRASCSANRISHDESFTPLNLRP